ncbi:MAG: Glu/Leu/Phe/Val dehydrogenase [Chloroflexi bacterium]|nr:Glu/Leu/Phe/Val dehydrogenase [Chloroflexota bacterium]
MNTLEYMARYNYEQVVFCYDGGTGLRAIIAIHDTTLGPALGGVRMRPYATEDEALTDVLRLARAMTYKAAIAGLAQGGGKAVIIGDPATDKTEALFHSMGRYVQALGGRYIATEDVGITVRDIEWLSAETEHVVGLPVSQGGSGDPSPPTAFTVLQAMKVCVQEKLAADSLKGRTVVVQGLGKVGYNLAHLLHDEGAIVVAADVNAELLRQARRELRVTAVDPDDIYDVVGDVFAPCAFGGILNSKTIPRLKCPIVCGSANNQLLEDADAKRMEKRGILYAPDYVANGGGVINLSLELTGYDLDAARDKLRTVGDTMAKVIQRSKSDKMTTAEAADRIVEERIAAARKVKPIYLE